MTTLAYRMIAMTNPATAKIVEATEPRKIPEKGSECGEEALQGSHEELPQQGGSSGVESSLP